MVEIHWAMAVLLLAIAAGLCYWQGVLNERRRWTHPPRHKEV